VNGAQIAVEALRREGVRHIFGLPGTTIMNLIDAAGQEPDVRYLSVRHEQVAAFMADGYARAGGGIGVCMASRGPGAANLAIGVHNAHAESVPVLALVGQVSDGIYYRDAFEEMDLVRFFEPITKWSAEVHSTARIPELMQRAVRTALSGRPGPVLVSLPLDVQTAEADVAYQPRFRPARPAPQSGDVEDAVARLAAADRPLAILGGGAAGRRHDASLIKLAERLQLPVVTTWLRKNVFPNDSPLFCGSLGYGAVAATEDLVRQADVVLAIGCRFSEFTSQRWTLLPPDATLIQVDIDPGVLGQYYVPDLGICADSATTTTAMLAAADGRELDRLGVQHGRAARAAAARRAYLEQTHLEQTHLEQTQSGQTQSGQTRLEQAGIHRASAGPPAVSSAALIIALREVLGSTRAILVQDAPSFGTWIHRHLDFTEPGSFYASAGGSMGWGFPAAMGIQLARPDARVVNISGDGSFWMVAQDLETAVREDLPVVTVINNNFSFGNTRDRQRTAHGGRYVGVFYGNPDFAAYARLLGAHGERVETEAGLLPALERAMASGRPAVVDVIQDRHEGLPSDLAPPIAR
jgi:acetolactate synthase I/II/III large subunit